LAGSTLALINDAAVATCDALDGVVDGVIDDPLSCPFEPASLLCTVGQDPNTCLTAAQVDAWKKFTRGRATRERARRFIQAWSAAASAVGEDIPPGRTSSA